MKFLIIVQGVRRNDSLTVKDFEADRQSEFERARQLLRDVGDKPKGKSNFVFIHSHRTYIMPAIGVWFLEQNSVFDSEELNNSWVKPY